jgi:hypothetical protein
MQEEAETVPLIPACNRGLDLYTFADVHGRVRRVGEHTRITAAFGGTIVKIDRDFLGKSIFMGHELFADDGRQLVSAYGHTDPMATVALGKEAAAGEIIAAIAGGSGRKTSVPLHVHLTFA